MSSSSFTPSTNLANFANASQAGIVSTTAQTFGGEKTFNGGIIPKQTYVCSVYRVTDVAVSVGTGTTLIFNNKRFDPNNNYNTTNGLYTAPKTGIYLVSYLIRTLMGSTAASSVQTEIKVSSSSDILLLANQTNMLANAWYSFSASGIVQASAGNTINAALTVAGQAITFGGTGSTNDVSYMSILYLGPIT